MPPTIPEILDDVLADFDLDSSQLLVALVEAVVARHVDVELRRLGRREPYPIHNERADALKAVNDALHQARCAAEAAAKGRQADNEPSGQEEPDREAILRAVMVVLMNAQFAAEKAAGIGGDDDDDRPRMRLVR